ncbi:MAG: DNA polymerase III subunit beta [Deltaproteobacteria bacterium]|nr:DNA polymerase III subunit beta [Deltaproteobacteria bacterium]
MEVVAPKKSLGRLLSRCQGVADRRSTMPVLANVLLTAEGNVLHVAATDLYVSVSGGLDAEVERAGSIAVPAREMYERVNAMPDGPVRITVSETATIVIKATASARRYTLHGLPGADFPALPRPEEEAVRLVLPVQTLGRLIARTHFSISPDETRSHLNSALFECASGLVRMVSTDGHRLSKMEMEIEEHEASATMLVPLKAIKELRRLSDEAAGSGEEGSVTISQAGPNAFFELGGIQFSVKLVDAQFPPYEQVIPSTSERVVRTSRLQLLDALKAVKLAASDRTKGVKLSLAQNALHITSESPESGSGFDEVSIDYEGPEMCVGFNAEYLMDVLTAIDDDEVTLGLTGELDPAVLRPATKTDDRYVAVVMPMRV